MFASTRSIRVFSTLRIFPRIGKIACVRGSRPWPAEPPAESPSTINTSHSEGSLLEQSFNFPGKLLLPSKPLRLRAKSRALRAANRAVAACKDLRAMSLPCAGFFSNQAASSSFTTFCTNALASVFPSLVLV